jgi:UDP-glucose 4-epimerase
MRVVLTGASGFLGRNLLLGVSPDWQVLAVYSQDASFPLFLEALRNRNVAGVRCDLARPDAVKALFDEHGREWDACLFLAAKVDIPWSVREPRLDLLAHTGPLLNVLEHLRAERCIFFCCGAVFDGWQGEAQPQQALAPTLPYAISKLACERYVHFYAERARTLGAYLNVRFFGAYGPYEAPHKIYTRLVQTFAFDRVASYTIYGDGQNVIDAMYVDDAVEAIRRMLTGEHWNDTVNLAAGTPVTIETLVRDVASVLGMPEVRIEKTGVANESNQFWGSTRELREHYQFEPSVDLRSGIYRLRDHLALTLAEKR